MPKQQAPQDNAWFRPAQPNSKGNRTATEALNDPMAAGPQSAADSQVLKIVTDYLDRTNRLTIGLIRDLTGK